ncbi:acyltransferase family protein [Amycolatopsis sp. 195334CR]|uniref:acyltransferase family protein n=1 Tax=Amycolatopsis sp. 195334CR TaxID=2814588 RepID=UPI001A8C9E4A|nr:acyltransferase family protein [Amycolatopsis sp. 195334CR]MBN6037303.1 acyltransferase [Amycolatopsis sp. 195334CR]
MATQTPFRTDIQALRAIAVLAVVFNHLWPTGLTGGYVGVDVFFVISGFLITSHLGREVGRTGRIRLGKFYARRARRLLPAALLVLFFSLLAAYFVLPFPRWETNAQEILASAFYVQNWLLAANSVDYSALSASASLAQHYWSLSVEEQFYLCWPLLLLLLFRVRGWRAMTTGIAIAGAASLAYCVYLTATSKEAAYFVTPVRVWEFAIGALLALCALKIPLLKRERALASAAGFALILGSAVFFDHASPFPGWLALLPTVGTGLVILGGTRPGDQWHTRVTAARPVQFLGGISYSLYLWHWPLIVLAPFVLGSARLSLWQQLGLLAVSVLLAWLTKRFVEDRGLSWQPLARSARATFTAVVAGMAVIALASTSLTWAYDDEVAESELAAKRDTVKVCHGAAALAPDSGCEAPFGPAKVPYLGPSSEYHQRPPECGEWLDTHLAGDTKTVSVCDFSGGTPRPKVAWLVGDSHAQQWQAPLFELAREHGWVVKLGLLGACPMADISYRGFRGNPRDSDEVPECTHWSRDLASSIAAERPAYVFTSFYARQETADDGSGRSQLAQYREGLGTYWSAWTGAGAKVYVLADPPLNGDVRQPDCVSINAHNPAACGVDRKRAQPLDPLTEAARTSRDPGVGLIDLTDYFCDAKQCHGVIGNVVVYYDADHLNREYATSLKPMIAAELGITEG